MSQKIWLAVEKTVEVTRHVKFKPVLCKKLTVFKKIAHIFDPLVMLLLVCKTMSYHFRCYQEQRICGWQTMDCTTYHGCHRWSVPELSSLLVHKSSVCQIDCLTTIKHHLKQNQFFYGSILCVLLSTSQTIIALIFIVFLLYSMSFYFVHRHCPIL